MIIMKFGGTSVGSASAIKQIFKILTDSRHKDKPLALVVSALAGVTDGLIGLARLACQKNIRYRNELDDIRHDYSGLAAEFIRGEELTDAFRALESRWRELDDALYGVCALGELSPRTLDLVMSFGERQSATLLTHILNHYGFPAAYLDARTLVKTDAEYGNARFLQAETSQNIREFFADSKNSPPTIQIITGFIGSNSQGETTTLGRGGSDLTASLFGAALDAEVVEIWTDVDGILTANPTMVAGAFRIEEVSYHEAMELSHFGAKVLYPPTLRPSLEKGIAIKILNTFNPDCAGTLIKDKAGAGAYPIRGISSLHEAALIRVQGAGMVGVAGFSARLFGSLARKKINIMLISQSSSEYSICFAVCPADITASCEAINEEFARGMGEGLIDSLETRDKLAVIAVVGAQMRRSSGCSGKFFHALGRNGINVIAIAQGSSELNISAVIAQVDEAKALNAVHEAFFRDGVRSVNLFLVGTGLIGGTLLEQIAAHREILSDEHSIRIHLAGVADSKRMVFSDSADGIDPKTALVLLKSDSLESRADDRASSSDESFIKEDSVTSGSGMVFCLEGFIERMRAMNLPNTAFCDCTASDVVAGRYEEILRSAIPIVTPNKRANSGALDYYRRITRYSRERGIPYLYETTVCAGLPVISALRDLFLSGDKVRRIEAVLSGTLSYIFNNFDGRKTFSALVKEARAKGYTEPDPRDDLNAMDAARKALVLARECGMSLEFSAVSIESILPSSCFEAENVEDFFAELEKADADFEGRRAAAESAGKALRYIAVIENDSAKISIRAEPVGSPFRSLTDADNIVVITSDRYSSLPMVIKGPGAGAQVTAGGVFADIVRIAKTII